MKFDALLYTTSSVCVNIVKCTINSKFASQFSLFEKLSHSSPSCHLMLLFLREFGLVCTLTVLTLCRPHTIHARHERGQKTSQEHDFEQKPEIILNRRTSLETLTQDLFDLCCILVTGSGDLVACLLCYETVSHCTQTVFQRSCGQINNSF